MYEINAKTTDATDYIQEDVLSLRIKNERLEQEKCELLGIIQGKDEMIADLKKKLAEAENLLRKVIRVTWGEGWNYSIDWKVKAEQFLKDEGCPDCFCEDCAKDCGIKELGLVEVEK